MADEVTLPTEEEIAQLPRWARVAFAARCARRALPLFKKYWPDAPKRHPDAIIQAIEFAEQAAGAAHTVVGIYSAKVAAAYATAAKAAAYASKAAAYAAKAAGYAANDAAYAAYDANDAAYAVTNVVSDDDAIGDADDFAADAAKAAWSAGIPLSDIRKDFIKLQNESILRKWTDDTPVPPSVFDSLDEPAHALLLDLHSEPGADPHIIGDAIVKLWEAANEYHMAKGGGVLTLDEFQQFMPALVPVAPSVGG